MDIKALQQENTKREKQVSKENNKDYTNMIVYLRGAKISLLSQEKIRSDILEMLLEGQGRGESVKEIFGSDLKAFCDEVIKSHPVELKKGRDGLLVLKSAFFLFSLFLFTEILLQFLFNRVPEEGMVQLSIFTLITPLIIAVGSVYFVRVVIRDAFSESKKTLVLGILFTLLILGSMSLSMTSSISSKVSLQIPLWMGLLLAGVSLLFYALMSWITKENN